MIPKKHSWLLISNELSKARSKSLLGVWKYAFQHTPFLWHNHTDKEEFTCGYDSRLLSTKNWEFRVSKLHGACSLVFPSFRKSSYPDETHILLGSSGCVGGTDLPLKLETSKTLLVPDEHRISRKGWAKIFIYPNSKLPTVPPIPSSFIHYSILLLILQAQFI